MNGCPAELRWLYIFLSFFFTSSVMLLFYGGQLTANYMLNREVNTPELVHGIGGEGGKPDTTAKNIPMPLLTDPEKKGEQDWL